MTSHPARPRRLRVVATGVIAAATVLLGLGLLATLGGHPASAATTSVSECNNTGTVGGDTIACTITVTNNFTYNPATPDDPTGSATIVTIISCTGSASCPTSGSTTSAVPVAGITQCNAAGLGGASTVTCTATVTNNLTGYPIGAAIDSTVTQCQNPGGVTTLTCVATPPGNDRAGTAGPGGQSVTQCDASGGAGGTMTCTVTAPPSQSTGLPTAISQCGASGPTGASTVTCTATITNNFIASTSPSTSTTATATSSTTTGGSGSSGGGGSSSGSGSSGGGGSGTGSSSGASGTDTSSGSSGAIPAGSPGTGGNPPASRNWPLEGGVALVLLAGIGATRSLWRWRRRQAI
jgi:hypothetical protein